VAQFAEPSADTNNPGSWVDEAGGSTSIYTHIDEGSGAASDADYIKSPLAPTSAVYVTKLSTIEDPQSSSGHVLRVRRAKDAAGGSQIDLTHELRQGYVSEVSQGTLIKQVAETNITNTFSTTATTLSSGEADAITDYSSLYVRLLANQV
jgi:hypothetical protein